MNRNWSEALGRHGSSVCRWVGAMFAAVALTVGVGPAFAADVNTLKLQLRRTRIPRFMGLGDLHGDADEHQQQNRQ